MSDIVFLGVQLAVAIACFILGKYVFPHISQDSITILTTWANAFVIWARKFFESASGEEKMLLVIEQLAKVAKANGLKVTDEQLRAIAQTAYEAMIAGGSNDAT